MELKCRIVRRTIKMRKILTTILAGALALGIAGCESGHAKYVKISNQVIATYADKNGDNEITSEELRELYRDVAKINNVKYILIRT